jgi:hypothetical protein
MTADRSRMSATKPRPSRARGIPLRRLAPAPSDCRGRVRFPLPLDGGRREEQDGHFTGREEAHREENEIGLRMKGGIMICLLLAAVLSAQAYTVTEIPALDIYSRTVALDMNTSGEVFGRTSYGPFGDIDDPCFAWRPDGTMTALNGSPDGGIRSMRPAWSGCGLAPRRRSSTT